MKSIVSLAVFMGALQVWAYNPANMSEESPEKVPVQIEQAYIPGGFDSNDRAQLVVTGYLPNSCYRVGPYEKKLDVQFGEITVTQTAYKYKGQCLMRLVPFTETVQVGLLRASKYKVKDGTSGREVGELPVSLATNVGPDDQTYALVSDAYVAAVDGAHRAIVLQGELPGDCWTISDKKVVLDGKNVITVLPVISEVQKAKCNTYRIPFVTTVEIPAVTPGKYLIHVRSLNGQAINKVVDL